MQGREQSAYSLLEILIVMALTGLTLVTLIGVFLKGQMLSRNSERLTVASDLALAVIENSRQLEFTEVPDNSVFSSKNGDLSVSGFPPPPYQINGSPALEVTTKLISPTLKSVVVKAEYAPDRQVVLETYVRP